LDFAPSERYQVAGIGLRSSTDWRDWIFFRRTSAGGNDQTLSVARTLDNRSERVASVPFDGTTAYLRIVRSEPLVSFYFSLDRRNWEPLLEEFVMGFPDDNWLFLSTYSTTGNGIQATFSDLTLSRIFSIFRGKAYSMGVQAHEQDEKLGIVAESYLPNLVTYSFQKYGRKCKRKN